MSLIRSALMIIGDWNPISNALWKWWEIIFPAWDKCREFWPLCVLPNSWLMLSSHRFDNIIPAKPVETAIHFHNFSIYSIKYVKICQKCLPRFQFWYVLFINRVCFSYSKILRPRSWRTDRACEFQVEDRTLVKPSGADLWILAL